MLKKFLRPEAVPIEEDKSAKAAGLNFLEAIEAHVRWKVRLEEYISGISDEILDAEVVCRDDKCVLGKWIYGEGGANYGTHPKFIGIRETHKDFHRCAGQVIRFVDSGEIDQARDLLNKGEYAKCSHQIKAELARLSLELDADL